MEIQRLTDLEQLLLLSVLRSGRDAHAGSIQDVLDGCCSLGTLCSFESSLAEYGAWCYPRLFWECGLLGQVLYLEAEAVGLGGTGIGCFFDDPVHSLLGLSSRRYQSLYHFTIGQRVEDSRITTLPAYSPERREGGASALA